MARDTPGEYMATISKLGAQGQDLHRLPAQRAGCHRSRSLLRPRPGRRPCVHAAGWDELSPAFDPSHFTVDNLPTRLRHLAQDPWADIGRLDQVLPGRSSARRRRRA